MRSIYRLLSFVWLFRALSRGPGAFGKYAVRRKARRTAHRGLNKTFRSIGLTGGRKRR
jgi:hypothetical protein